MPQKGEMVKKTLAGLFFIASVMLIVIVVFTIGFERGLTEPKFQMIVLYRNIGGLAIGAPVTLSGVNVGTIADIEFLEEEVDGRGVKVTLDLFQKYEKQLYKSTNFAIKTEGVLGEKIVEISTDPDFRRDNLHGLVVGEDPLDLSAIALTFSDAAKSLSETSTTMNAVSKEIKKVTGTTRRLLNRIEQRIIEGNLFKVF